MHDNIDFKEKTGKFLLNIKNKNFSKNSFIINEEDSKTPNINFLKEKLNTQIHPNKNNLKIKKFLSIIHNNNEEKNTPKENIKIKQNLNNLFKDKLRKERKFLKEFFYIY